MLRIQQLREEHNLSQRALAAKISANPKTVNFWEHGQSEPSAGFIIALADVFECTTDYILGREDDLGSVNVMRGLTADEQQILQIFTELSQKEQSELLTYAQFLLSRSKKQF